MNREQQYILYKGRKWGKNNLNEMKNLITTEEDFFADLVSFLEEWFDDSPLIKVHTSGSTGKPKEMMVKKDYMENSARLTCATLGLKAEDKALLCMPLKYIAGKMLVVRALVCGLELIIQKPCGHPLSDITEHIKFAAMIPLQVYNSLLVDEEKEKFKNIDTVIIGGGSIDAAMEKKLKDFPNRIYSTYGMTETLSHIALRKINGEDASSYYKPFDTVKISVDENNALIIEAPAVSDIILHTNDIVDLKEDGSFRIIGRKDNIINTGGIKIQIEQVEEKLKEIIDFPFAITSVPDNKFGEIIILLIESNTIPQNISEKIESILSKYERPKKIFTVKRIPTTETGKISRAKCKEMALTVYMGTETD